MAKTRVAGIILSALLISPSVNWAAETPGPSLLSGVTAAQPAWSDLSVEQKIVLAPLCDDWDSLDSFRQKKWLGIAANFAKLSPDEQRRIQGQMQTWGKLSAAQREQAREKFKLTSQLSAEKKAAFKAKWEEYSRLPPDEKEKFAQQAIKDSAAKTALSNNATPLAPPTHSANPAANAGAESAPHPTEAPSPEVSSPP